jgi:PBP1b-binding outer membrane lipoprotein LpoB
MNKMRIISWLLLSILLFNSCTYYRLRQGSPKDYYVGLEESEMKKNRIFVHIGDAYFELSNWKKVDDKITGIISSVPPEIDLYYQRALTNKNFRISKGDRFKLLQLHLFLPELAISGNEITFDVNQIQKAQIIEYNVGLTTFSWIVSSAAITTATIGIFVAVACSCPHIYLNDGQQWYFSNSMFTGAMNPTLERFDYKKINDVNPLSSELNLEIRNEEKEIQYTNLLKLVAVYHEKGEEIITTSTGDFIKIVNSRQPKSLSNDNGIMTNDFLMDESNSYSFNSTDNSGFSNLQASFESNNLKNPHLVLGLKNPKWGGFVYHEFTKLFGDYFQTWVSSNSKKTKNQLEQNMEKAGITLKVEVLDKGKWKTVDQIKLVGEAKFEKIAVKIPENYLKNKELTVRLKSGFQFWEVNYLALAEKDSKKIEVEEYDAQIVSDATKSEDLALDDKNYLIHKEGDAPIKVNFSGLKTNSERTLYLKSKGYYKTVQNFEGKPQWNQLLSINKQGGLSHFSKAKFDDWNEMASIVSELGLTKKLLQTNK